jgi:hypothetical protein
MAKILAPDPRINRSGRGGEPTTASGVPNVEVEALRAPAVDDDKVVHTLLPAMSSASDYPVFKALDGLSGHVMALDIWHSMAGTAWRQSSSRIRRVRSQNNSLKTENKISFVRFFLTRFSHPILTKGWSFH